MPYYEGTSLEEKIKSGPLKIEEAINLSIQIAEGLKCAHEAGISLLFIGEHHLVDLSS